MMRCMHHSNHGKTGIDFKKKNIDSYLFRLVGLFATYFTLLHLNAKKSGNKETIDLDFFYFGSIPIHFLQTV